MGNSTGNLRQRSNRIRQKKNAGVNYIHRKCTGGYKLYELQEKVNRLIYMDDINLFIRKKKQQKTGNPNTGNDAIQ